jgi:transcription elongation factor GreA
MDTIPMTPAGHKRLKEELQQLKSVERPKVIQEVATAREHGDLRENAEYHAAREKHSFIEARIKDIEAKLSLAEVIDPTKLSGNKVAFGAHVRLSNADTGEEVTYWIVGPAEADSDAGHISVQSPLARQLLGRQVGDEVKVKTPGGTREYEVLDITFG